MTTGELPAACGFACAVQADARTIGGVFCGDLLSWALVRANAGDAWCTVMSGANTVAVAAAAGCACVVLCHGVAPDGAMQSAAAAHGVNLFATRQTEFEAALTLAQALRQA